MKKLIYLNVLRSFHKESRMQIRFLMIAILSSLITVGCESQTEFKRETQTAWLPEHQRGITLKKANLLQVKHLSRDLEWCLDRADLPSLEEEDFANLTRRNNKEAINKLNQLAPYCTGITNYLSGKIDLARRSGHSRKAIYKALLDGQADAISEE